MEEIDNLIIDSLKQLEFFNVLEKISKFATTEYGRNQILNSLPESNLETLTKEISLIEQTINLVNQYENIPFENFGDIRARIYKSQIENAVLSTGEILDVLNFLQISRNIRSFILSKSEDFPELAELVAPLYENRIIEKHIRDTIDETGNIRDTASKELLRIRNEIIEKSAKLRRRLEKILRHISQEDLAQDEFITIREGRFVLPIKIEYKNKLSGIIHGVSQSGQTCFVEPAEVIEMNNELSLLENEERREIFRILKNLTEEIGAVAVNLLYSADILIHLDVLLAKAKYALQYNCQKPHFWNSKEIFLQDIRHPILVHTRGFKNVVPLTISFTEKKRGHVISGPNAGGKTVSLKSIGLNLALALSGFYTHGYCKTNYFKIYTSIGDLQSIEQDLSTFSSQIIRIKSILENADVDSLVLIDEIVSGTDPHEGSLLAASIIDSFINMNLLFAVTTHQSYLKVFSLTRDEVENDSLEFDEINLKPTYKFLQGVPGNSYAFELASILGLPKHIIERARSYLSKTENEIEEQLKIVYQLKIQAEKLKAELEAEKLKYEKLRMEYENLLKELKAKRKELLDNAKVEAYEIIRKANALVENTIKEIREQQKSISTIKKDFIQKKREVEDEAKKVFTSLEQTEKTLDILLEGDYVYIDEPSNVGQILKIYEKTNEALVELNGLKFKTKLNKLHKIVRKETEWKPSPQNYIKFTANTKLDVRGLRANEAIQQVDKFISEAILSNVDTITIIHGKGTGALRQSLHEFFKSHPQVESFSEGTIEEGGAGVTIVKLR
ncbi:MAG: endonuclease MutS2 [Candidatus Kapaibacteriota bacterium]|jgi:DNA mismatch repair protein MutS2